MTAVDTDRRRTRLERLCNGAVAWINSADSKAMAILTVGGALIALLAAVLAGVAATSTAPKPSRGELVLFIGFCVADLLSIAFSAWAIFPRTNRSKILKKANWKKPLPLSHTFFTDVAKLSAENFIAMIEGSDEKVDEEDAIEQAFVLQRVAHAKMWSIRLSIIALVLGLAALTGLTALLVTAAV